MLTVRLNTEKIVQFKKATHLCLSQRSVEWGWGDKDFFKQLTYWPSSVNLASLPFSSHCVLLCYAPRLLAKLCSSYSEQVVEKYGLKGNLLIYVFFSQYHVECLDTYIFNISYILFCILLLLIN